MGNASKYLGTRHKPHSIKWFLFLEAFLLRPSGGSKRAALVPQVLLICFPYIIM